MSNSVIVTEGLSRAFKETVAVDRLSLAVEPGEIFGLVGPDGAGKTTTIRMLTAILLPTSGKATVLGHDTVSEAEAIKGDIGYMAQRFNLYRDLTVEENLQFFADVYEVGGERRAQRIARLLRFAGLEEFRVRRADHLSGGMQKKLSLATTLLHEPKILFLDEPTTGVDPVSRREFWEILTDLHLEGITIFVSTPYMDEAERCSRVGLLYRGRLIECDTPGQIRQRVEGELLEVVTPRLRTARKLVAELEGVIQIQTYGDRLHIFLDDVALRRPQVEATLASADIPVQRMRTTRPRMEEAFISLVRERQEQ